MGNTEGRKLVVETFFAKYARTLPLNAIQKQLVVGSLLGDAYLMSTTAGYCYRVNHGLTQYAYVDWKYEMLKEYVRTKPRKSGKCYFFRTITHPEFSHYRELFYPNGRKVVPVELLMNELTTFGLAVWMMDDGSADGRALRLNTQSFSYEENILLSDLLRAKFGIIATLNRDRGYYRLLVSTASMKRLTTLVRAHILPDMLYKLPL